MRESLFILTNAPDPDQPDGPDPDQPVGPNPVQPIRPQPVQPVKPKPGQPAGIPQFLRPNQSGVALPNNGRFVQPISTFNTYHMHHRTGFPFRILFLGLFLAYTQPAASQAAGQQAADYSGYYKWNDVVQMYEWTLNDSTGQFEASTLSIASDLTGQFVVQAILYDPTTPKDSDVIIKYLYYLKDKKSGTTPSNAIYFQRYNFNGEIADFDKLSPQYKISRKFDARQKYFLVKLSIFKAHTIKIPGKVRTSGALGFGILNYPFKMRLQEKMQDFSGSFNVGAAVAYTFRHDSLSKWSNSIVGGFGISSINLDKSTVNNNANMLDSSNGITALTFSIGYMLEYSKIQVGVFMGVDKISNLNNSTYGWKYQGNPWFSIGIGYSIFSTSTSSQPTKTDTQP